MSKVRKDDLNVLAKSIVDQATTEAPEEADESTVSKVAKFLGRLGGLKGGPARAAALTSEERSDIARNAAKKRWEKKG